MFDETWCHLWQRFTVCGTARHWRKPRAPWPQGKLCLAQQDLMEYNVSQFSAGYACQPFKSEFRSAGCYCCKVTLKVIHRFETMSCKLDLPTSQCWFKGLWPFTTQLRVRQEDSIMPFQLAHVFFRLVWDVESLFSKAMASTGLGSVLRLLLLGLTLCSFKHGCTFAKLGQPSTASLREKSGLELREKVTEFIKLNPDEKRLLSKISTAGERRQWRAVRSALASYTGDAVPIFTAALHAAVRCREYREGAEIFEQGQQRCEFMNEPMYTQALKIFGKLKDFAKVDELWAEVLEVCDLDGFLVSARLGAAADKGDIQGAAAALDLADASSWVVVSSVLICLVLPFLGECSN